jgi:hypothetical protein
MGQGPCGEKTQSRPPSILTNGARGILLAPPLGAAGFAVGAGATGSTGSIARSFMEPTSEPVLLLRSSSTPPSFAVTGGWT